MIRSLALLAFLLLLAPPSVAAAEGRHYCALDTVAGHVLAPESGASITVQIAHGKIPASYPLPTCFDYGDVITAGDGVTVQIVTASGTVTFEGGPSKQYRMPDATGHPTGSATAFLSALYQIAFGPTEVVSVYATGRGGTACPPGRTVPPPLAALSRLPEQAQQIGSDLRVIVALWKPSEEPRLVRAKLLRPDGSVVAFGATCRGSTIQLPLRTGALHAGDALILKLTDEQGGQLLYDIAVVAPETLPQPPQSLGQDWLVAAWRLAKAGPGNRLDSVGRLAQVSETEFGAQRLLGAIATDTSF